MALVALLLLECALQVFYLSLNGDFLFRRVALPLYRPQPHRYYGMLPDLAYRHRTNEFSVTYYTDGQGLRSDAAQGEVPVGKAAGRYRLMFLGPSFTFGWGNDYEDIYPTLISRDLTVPGREVEVVNLGTPSQPAAWQLCWLEQEGYRYDPDLVVVTVYLGITHLAGICETPPSIRVEDGYLRADGSDSAWRGRAKTLATVFYAWYAYQMLGGAEGGPQGLGNELYPETRPPADDRVVEEYRRYIEHIHAALGRKIPVVFLHIPVSYAIRPSDAARWKHLGHHDPEQQRQQMAALAGQLDRASIAFVDPTNALLEGDAAARMYYFLDIHLTPAGNAAVAAAAGPVIQAAMEENGY